MIKRPLRGEPLSLDLVNTSWVDGGAPRDLFDDAGGVQEWLAEHGYTQGSGTALREVRAALRAVLERGERDRLNVLLAHGRRTPVLGTDGPGEIVDVDPDWRPAWDAAVDHIRLLADRPDRVRRCAHPACVLYFYDTSRNGTRRWCSRRRVATARRRVGTTPVPARRPQGVGKVAVRRR